MLIYIPKYTQKTKKKILQSGGNPILKIPLSVSLLVAKVG